jgi:carboxylesterase type B
MALYVVFADVLNCTARDVSCLRQKSVDEILDAQVIANGKLTSYKLPELFETWLPWLDGKLIKGQLLEPDKWNLKNFTLKAFIIGSLPEECFLYITIAWQKPLTIEEYIGLMLATFKKSAVKVLEFYKPDFSNPDQRNLTSAVGTRWIFSCSSRRFLENALSFGGSNYLYVFDYPLDFPGWDNFTTCYGHTCHGSDMPYTFDNPDGNFTATGHLLALSHIRYWTNFAKYGTPNGNGLNDLLYWPEYNSNNKTFLRFKDENSIENGYITDDCDFFDSIGYYH